MKFITVFALSIAAALGQNGGAVVGAGYNLIAPVSVTPGQVITIFVTGVGNVSQKILAGNPPLPLTLGGISASLVQGTVKVPAPILAVFPFSACSPGPAGLPCGTLTGVTVQIPFELYVNIPGSLRPTLLTYLQVSDDSGNVSAVMLDGELDEIHVLRSEDTVLAADLAQRAGSGSAVVTHADGSMVDASNPAKGGEVLVMYAVGLGAVNPPVKTGAASPNPAVPATGAFFLNFDYRPNAPPSPGFLFITGDPPPLPAPIFAGLTPGFAGLYQVNFVVPLPPAGLPPCVRAPGLGANPFASVLSNLTVTLAGRISFDGAAICVGAPAP